MGRREVVLWLGMAVVVAGCVERSAPPPEQVGQPVVYGSDDRLEPWAHPDPAWRAVAERTVVALIPPARLDRSDPEHVVVSGEPLGESLGLCADVPFFDQLRGARCSGTLIADDLVMTAGHCVDRYRCESRLYVFDWRYESEGQLASISESDIYRCAEVLAWELTDDDLDYAVVRLDRPVDAARRPATVRAEDTVLASGTPLTLVGFPNGLPVKIADHGRVNAPGGAGVRVFQAALDAFSGNSGSGVFGADGSVVGVLVRGESDFVPRGACDAVNVLPESLTDAEDVVYVGRVMEALCARGDVSHPVCEGTERSWCFPCGSDGECRDGFGCGHFAANPAVSFCAPSCGEDADCRADHRCDGGRCTPRTSPGCYDGDVYEVDACGRGLVLQRACTDDEVCAGGACVPRSAGDHCANAIELEPEGQLVEGNLAAGYTRALRGSCGGAGVDIVYTFEVDAPTTVTAFSRGLDTILHLRSACEDAGTELVCNDDHDPPGGRGSRIEATLEPGRYWLVVDVFDEEADLFELVVNFGDAGCETFCPPGRVSCDEEGVIRCVPDAHGCYAFERGEPCGEGEICLNGRCGEAGPGDACAGAQVIAPVTAHIEGDLSRGYAHQYSGSCNGGGPDRVWTFTLDRLTLFEARSAGFDSVLYLRRECEDGDTEVACHDDVDRPADLGSRLFLPLGAGTWSLFLDAYDEDVGPFSLDLAFETLCDDVCEIGETLCREGGARACVDGPDGCRVWGPASACEASSPCTNGTCDTACPEVCDADASRCGERGHPEVCGDGPEGCLDWVLSSRCDLVTEVCVEGACVPLSEAPAPVVFQVRGGGGCAIGGVAPRGLVGVSGLLGLLVALVALGRRGRRR